MASMIVGCRMSESCGGGETCVTIVFVGGDATHAIDGVRLLEMPIASSSDIGLQWGMLLRKRVLPDAWGRLTVRTATTGGT